MKITFDMLSLEDLRGIRDLEYRFGNRQTQERNHARHRYELRMQHTPSKPIATLRYDLSNGQLSVEELP